MEKEIQSILAEEENKIEQEKPPELQGWEEIINHSDSANTARISKVSAESMKRLVYAIFNSSGKTEDLGRDLKNVGKELDILNSNLVRFNKGTTLSQWVLIVLTGVIAISSAVQMYYSIQTNTIIANQEERYKELIEENEATAERIRMHLQATSSETAT